MRWLLDQGTPRSASGLLRDEGDDACHTGECGMAKAKDAEIIEWAVVEGRVIVTFDADFHALLASRSATCPSIIRIREEGLKAAEVVRLIRRIEAQFKGDLEQGCVITYHQGKVRMRRLPI
jgi:predicted nuclease of predicted toxin-antitoxin system